MLSTLELIVRGTHYDLSAGFTLFVETVVQHKK